jgi:hypothetical protein
MISLMVQFLGRRRRRRRKQNKTKNKKKGGGEVIEHKMCAVIFSTTFV